MVGMITWISRFRVERKSSCDNGSFSCSQWIQDRFFKTVRVKKAGEWPVANDHVNSLVRYRLNHLYVLLLTEAVLEYERGQQCVYTSLHDDLVFKGFVSNHHLLCFLIK